VKARRRGTQQAPQPPGGGYLWLVKNPLAIARVGTLEAEGTAGGGWSPVGVHLEQDGPPPGQAPLLGMRHRILDRKHGHSVHLDSRDVPHPVVEAVVGGGTLLCTGGNGTRGVHTGEHSHRSRDTGSQRRYRLQPLSPVAQRKKERRPERPTVSPTCVLTRVSALVCMIMHSGTRAGVCSGTHTQTEL
jgi:hypothetical protein